MSSSEDLIESTTFDEINSTIQDDQKLLTIFSALSKKFDIPIEEVAQDFARITAAKIDVERKNLLSEEQARMEGVYKATDENIKYLLKEMQVKYKLSDEYVDKVESNLLVAIDKGEIERARRKYKTEWFKDIRVVYYVLKIILLPVELVLDLLIDNPLNIILETVVEGCAMV